MCACIYRFACIEHYVCVHTCNITVTFTSSSTHATAHHNHYIHLGILPLLPTDEKETVPYTTQQRKQSHTLHSNGNSPIHYTATETVPYTTQQQKQSHTLHSNGNSPIHYTATVHLRVTVPGRPTNLFFRVIARGSHLSFSQMHEVGGQLVNVFLRLHSKSLCAAIQSLSHSFIS